MFAFFYNVIFLLAEAAGDHSASGGGGFTQFYNDYLNYSGFELWKFINLAIFVLLLVYLVKKPLSEAFKAKREAIRSELIKAEEAKQAALSQLMSAEAKLAALDAEKASLLAKAKDEAEAEKVNIAQQTETEIAKMREQAEGEITRLTQQTKAELRRFSAEESVRLAEEKLRGKINADNDAVLVKSGIEAIGGLS
ncbi:MAG: ATP synthase F0 subunit B [Acidobacteriota bacterium]